MNQPASNNPLQGITLEALLTTLVARYGWDGLARRVDLRCFKSDPSIKSSLRFLRQTPWARSRVEQIYIEHQQKHPQHPTPARSAPDPENTPG